MLKTMIFILKLNYISLLSLVCLTLLIIGIESHIKKDIKIHNIYIKTKFYKLAEFLRESLV